jgi:hypothetical protein
MFILMAAEYGGVTARRGTRLRQIVTSRPLWEAPGCRMRRSLALQNLSAALCLD